MAKSARARAKRKEIAKAKASNTSASASQITTAILKNATSTSKNQKSSSKPRPATTFHKFNQLPAELRLMILESYISSIPVTNTIPARPALFGVSRQIRQDTIRLYSQHMIRAFERKARESKAFNSEIFRVVPATPQGYRDKIVALREWSGRHELCFQLLVEGKRIRWMDPFVRREEREEVVEIEQKSIACDGWVCRAWRWAAGMMGW